MTQTQTLNPRKFFVVDPWGSNPDEVYHFTLTEQGLVEGWEDLPDEIVPSVLTGESTDEQVFEILAAWYGRAQEIGREVEPHNPKPPLVNISQHTRDLAKAGYDKPGTCDERFYGFMAEWVSGPRTPIEDAMGQIFVTTAHGYRSDFLLDLQVAGLDDGDGPRVFWLPNENGSHLFTRRSLPCISNKCLQQFKVDSQLFRLEGNECTPVNLKEVL